MFRANSDNDTVLFVMAVVLAGFVVIAMALSKELQSTCAYANAKGYDMGEYCKHD